MIHVPIMNFNFLCAIVRVIVKCFTYSSEVPNITLHCCQTLIFDLVKLFSCQATTWNITCNSSDLMLTFIRDDTKNTTYQW